MSEHHHEHDQIDPRLSAAVAAGCEESRLLLSRRALLGISAGLFSWACLPRHAEAFAGDPRLLIVILRGGIDGMHVAYKADEEALLRSYRGRMYEPFSRTTDYLAGYQPLGSSGFKVSGQMPNFATWFARGEAAVVHALAPPLRSRSHFDCQDNLENGQIGVDNPTKDGWLNRFLAGLSANVPMSRALSDGSTPLIMMGEAPVQSWTGATLGILGDAFNANLLQAYAQSQSPLFRKAGSLLASGLETNRLASQPAGTASSTPPSALSGPFRGTARLMRLDQGPRIAVLSVGGLDTHDGQILALDARLRDLDLGLAGFREELGPAAWANTIVCCVSEFGRTLRVNSAGTDHGTGTVALLAGGNVNGGRVLGDWPGISDLQDNRDLKATTDSRALFKALLRDHLGLSDMRYLNATVFPGSDAVSPLSGLVRTPAAARLALRV